MSVWCIACPGAHNHLPKRRFGVDNKECAYHTSYLNKTAKRCLKTCIHGRHINTHVHINIHTYLHTQIYCFMVIQENPRSKRKVLILVLKEQGWSKYMVNRKTVQLLRHKIFYQHLESSLITMRNCFMSQIMSLLEKVTSFRPLWLPGNWKSDKVRSQFSVYVKIRSYNWVHKEMEDLLIASKISLINK